MDYDKLAEVFDSIESNTKNTSEIIQNLYQVQSKELELTDASNKMQVEVLEQQKRASSFSKLGAAASGIGTGLGSGVSGIGGGFGAAASGIGGGLGSILGGAGKGIGFAGAGIGAALLGLSTVIDKIPSADEIKDSVETLLTIGEGYESRYEFLKEGGTLALMLGGLGLGLAAFGIGAAATGGAQGVLEYFGQGDWTEKVKQNILTLLSIGDEAGGNLKMLVEGGAVTAALSGLGVGLGIFGVGSAVAGAAEGLNTFMDTDNWAQRVKNNVLTLLSIGDDAGGNLGMLVKGAAFPLAMTGLAAGLVAFSIGSSVGGIGEAIASFTSGEDWSQQIKDHVITLLSISDLEGLGWDTVKFAAVMTGIGAGLAAFSVGATAVAIGNGAASFTSGEDWSQQIKDHVTTLLSISNLEGVGADTGAFLATMTGIGAGLAAFGFGSTVAGVGEAITKFAEGGDFAERIKSQVDTLFGIVDGSDESKADQFVSAMSKISDGLTSFAGGQFVGTLAGAATAILGMFGANNPFDQIMAIADKSDNLERGADALIKISQALNSLGGIELSGLEDIDFEKFGRKLGTALPVLDGLANGGKIGGGWFDGPELDFGPRMEGAGGVLNPNLKLDEVVVQFNKVRQFLGGSILEPVMSSVAPTVTQTSTTTITSPEYGVAQNAEVNDTITSPEYGVAQNDGIFVNNQRPSNQIFVAPDNSPSSATNTLNMLKAATTSSQSVLARKTEALDRSSVAMNSAPSHVVVRGGDSMRSGDVYNNGGNTSTTTIINNSLDPTRSLRHVPM